jgi:heptosyltransferase II
MVKLIKISREHILLGLSFLLSPFLYLRKKKIQDGQPLRILVIQTARIGDMVCSTPVFREIKKRYPKSFLSVLVIPLVKDVLANNPHLDEVILLDREKHPGLKGVFELISQIREREFDWSFSLLPGMLNNLVPFWAGIPNRMGTTSKWSTKGVKVSRIFSNHYLEYQRDTLALRHYLKLLEIIGINQASEKKEIFVGPKQRKKAAAFLRKNHLGEETVLVGITVTAGKKIKEWAPEKFSKLSDRLIEELGAKVVFIGSKNDEAVIRRIQSSMNSQSFKATEFNLKELAGLLKQLSLFISVDTGPLYMADALGTPVIDIVGPHDVKSQSPSGNFVIVQKMPPCGPCSFISSAPSYCREGHLKCLKDIQVEDVFQAVEKILEKK